MLFSISWRNIWRNKVRSLVIIFSIALGIFAGVSAMAFMKGMTKQRIQKVIKTELSYIQIHKEGFKHIIAVVAQNDGRTAFFSGDAVEIGAA